MKIDSLTFRNSLFKFKVPDEIKTKLGHDDFIALTEIGLPRKILSNSFVYNETIIENSAGELILGYNTHVNGWQLKVSLVDFSIYFSGTGELTPEVSAFYNSSIPNLILSLFTYDFFLRRLIMSKSFGEYHLNHGKYANLLFELIKDIDKVATEKGVWFSLIEEMRLGVI